MYFKRIKYTYSVSWRGILYISLLPPPTLVTWFANRNIYEIVMRCTWRVNVYDCTYIIRTYPTYRISVVVVVTAMPCRRRHHYRANFSLFKSLRKAERRKAFAHPLRVHGTHIVRSTYNMYIIIRVYTVSVRTTWQNHSLSFFALVYSYSNLLSGILRALVV